MPEPEIRKTALQIETIWHEGGPAAEVPLKKGAALVVIKNPFAGAYHAEIAGFMDDLKPLGLRMAREARSERAAQPEATAETGVGEAAVEAEA